MCIYIHIFRMYVYICPSFVSFIRGNYNISGWFHIEYINPCSGYKLRACSANQSKPADLPEIYQTKPNHPTYQRYTKPNQGAQQTYQRSTKPNQGAQTTYQRSTKLNQTQSNQTTGLSRPTRDVPNQIKLLHNSLPDGGLNSGPLSMGLEIWLTL